MIEWHQYVLGFLFVAAGFFHFQKPKLYIRIMPAYLPAHSSMVLISGALEMILGLMLLNQGSQSLAAWCLIVLLVSFFTVHIHMLRDEAASMNLPKWVLWLRLPLQLGLIYWVYQYV